MFWMKKKYCKLCEERIYWNKPYDSEESCTFCYKFEDKYGWHRYEGVEDLIDARQRKIISASKYIHLRNKIIDDVLKEKIKEEQEELNRLIKKYN